MIYFERSMTEFLELKSAVYPRVQYNVAIFKYKDFIYETIYRLFSSEPDRINDNLSCEEPLCRNHQMVFL